MAERRMSYRLPEKKFNQVNEKLSESGKAFEEFIDKAIDMYISGELDPKLQTEGWGTWMEKD